MIVVIIGITLDNANMFKDLLIKPWSSQAVENVCIENRQRTLSRTLKRGFWDLGVLFMWHTTPQGRGYWASKDS